MSIAEAAPPIHKRPLLRRWFPLIVLVLAVLAWIAVWTWPDDELERGWRVGKSMAIISTSVLLWSVWLLFLSGWLWWLRLGTLAAIVLATWGAIGGVKFSGDVIPDEIRFRWERSPVEVLEEHRRQQEKVVKLAPLQLPAELTADFPEYRGARRDGIVQGPPLARDWKAQPPRLLWRQPVGGGYASFAVAGNLAVTIEQRGDEEAIVAYDTATGRERWVHQYPSRFNETLGGEGPRATPTIAGEDVFALGALGQLTCLKASTGDVNWSVNILQDNDNVQWGMSGSPLVYDNIMVVNPGGQREHASILEALVAYDRTTGKRVWGAGTSRAAYGSPMLADLAGRRQILIFDAAGLAGHDAATGKELWRFPWETYMGINVAQPVVLPDDRIFISSGYNTGCALLDITAGLTSNKPKEIWRTKALRAKMTSPVFYNGYLYGMDDGILTCVDVATGERKWRDGRYGHGQLLLSGDLLVIQAESGKLVLVEANAAGHRELGSIPVFTDKTWNCPALANGKVYLRNHKEMACYDLAARDK